MAVKPRKLTDHDIDGSDQEACEVLTVRAIFLWTVGMLRIIGDVHGKSEAYLELINQLEPGDKSICVGDMGFDYEFLKPISFVQHRFVMGNHDNYDNRPPHALPDFGLIQIGDQRIFHVRGAMSVDRNIRFAKELPWYQAEELSIREGHAAILAYEKSKPTMVISHDCPEEVANELIGPKIRRSRTRQLLQSMFEVHQPTQWFFGHHHRNWQQTIGGCEFHCLGELSFVDLPLSNELVFSNPMWDSF